MARRTPRPTAPFSTTLTPLRETCEACGTRWWVAYHRRRKIMTLEGLWQLTVIIGQCPNPTCPLYHVRYHPEEEGRWALPHGECDCRHWRLALETSIVVSPRCISVCRPMAFPSPNEP
jgi:hypothetical protein